MELELAALPRGLPAARGLISRVPPSIDMKNGARANPDDWCTRGLSDAAPEIAAWTIHRRTEDRRGGACGISFESRRQRHLSRYRGTQKTIESWRAGCEMYGVQHTSSSIFTAGAQLRHRVDASIQLGRQSVACQPLCRAKEQRRMSVPMLPNFPQKTYF